jgi:hypothetical protein
MQAFGGPTTSVGRNLRLLLLDSKVSGAESVQRIHLALDDVEAPIKRPRKVDK